MSADRESVSRADGLREDFSDDNNEGDSQEQSVDLNDQTVNRKKTTTFATSTRTSPNKFVSRMGSAAQREETIISEWNMKRHNEIQQTSVDSDISEEQTAEEKVAFLSKRENFRSVLGVNGIGG